MTAEEKPKEVQPPIVKLELTDQAKTMLLELEKQGKISLEKKIEEKFIIDIAAQLRCSKATVYLARNKILAERAAQAKPVSEVKIEVVPQPKPPIQHEAEAPIHEGQKLPEGVRLVPLSEKIDVTKIFMHVKGLLEGFGIQVPSDEDLQNLGEFWKPALSGTQVRVHERVIEGDTVLYIAAGATALTFAAPIIAQVMKPKEKKPETSRPLSEAAPEKPKEEKK